ncbi:hypothetical protein DINM_020878 [Dirofilaria immitis]|nr:hypothetical protein [Dirofilaria immitis]
MESEVEKNEQSLSRISEFTGINKARFERTGISNSNPHARDNLQNTTIIPQQGTPTRYREQLLKNSVNKIYVSQRNRKTQPAGRPVSLHSLVNYDHSRSIVSSLQDVRNTTIRSPCSTPIMTRRTNLNERPRTVDHESPDSFGNKLAKYDTPLSHSSGSSDYAVINAKQLYMEKRSTMSKRSSSINPSRLPHLRKNISHTSSPPLLGDFDGRNVCHLRRNPETVGVIREKNTGPAVSKISRKADSQKYHPF